MSFNGNRGHLSLTDGARFVFSGAEAGYHNAVEWSLYVIPTL